MRNLKRALSLTLASVMLLGMMVVGTSALSFNDADGISNVTAASVLEDLGVMVGDGKGNFMPDQTVTRAQMAIITCRMLYGSKLNVNQFADASQFTDVPANEYYNGYINLASSLGIVNGYGDGRFGPDDPVTTAQAALMLTRALGYYKNGELTGDWGADALTAVTLGTRLGVFNELALGISAPLSRDNVCAMTFNAMTRATPVKFNNILKEYYTDGGGVTDGVAYIDAYEYGDPGSEYGLTLGYTVYGLYISADTRDDFGRPAEEWSYENGGVIGTFNKAPIKVYTAKASKGELFNLLGGNNVGKLTAAGTAINSIVNGTSVRVGTRDSLQVFVDGVGDSDGTGTLLAFNNNSAIQTNYFVRNDSAGGYSGNGIVTEVYQDENNNVTLVYYNTYVMQATGDYNSANGRINISVLTSPVGQTVTDINLNVDEFPGITDLKEDDYILYTYAKGKIQTVAKAEVVTGTVDAYSAGTGKNFMGTNQANPGASGEGAGGYVTIAGQKYDYARAAEVDSDNGCAVTYTVGNDAAIVVDKYGYAIYVDNAALSVGNFVYIAGVAADTNLSTVVSAEAYFSDGTTETITVREMTYSGTKFIAAGSEDTTATSTLGLDLTSRETGIAGWYNYSKDSRGRYNLTQAATSAKVANTNGNINSDRVAIGGNNAAIGNGNTIFVVRDKNDDLKVYTGVNSVPDIVNFNADNTFYMKNQDNASKAVSVVFVDAKGGTVRSSEENLLYLLQNTETKVDKTTNESVYVWKALIDGKPETIESKVLNSGSLRGNLYDNYSIDSDGYYEASSDDLFDAEGYNDGEGTRDANKAYSVISDQTVSHSGQSVSIAGKNYIINENTSINVVLIPSGTGNIKDITVDDSANHETRLGLSGANLNSMFRGYTISGELFVVYDDKNDKDLVTDLYLWVDGATFNGVNAPVLADATYEKDATATALDATMPVQTGYVYTYAWQKWNGTAWVTADGTANQATYNPAVTAIGATKYRVEVSIAINGGTPIKVYSNEVTITVTAKALTAPTLTGASYAVGASATALTGTTSAANGGTVSYEWYKNTTNSTTGATKISGATGATQAPGVTADDIGVTYYYVVVTEKATGTDTVLATVTSNIVAVTVKPAKLTYAAGSAAGDATAKTVTITSTGDYEVGTYNLYKGNDKVGTLSLDAKGKVLAFKNVTGTIETGNYTITIVVNSQESEKSDNISVTVS